MPIAKPSLEAPDRPDLPDVLPYRMNGHHVVVVEPVPLGAGGRPTAQAVQFLRECQSHALTVTWSVPQDDALCRTPSALDFPLHHLRHLPPPDGPVPDDWRSAYAYGRFYHRQGPGFVQIKDRRDPDAAVRLTVDHPDLVSTFGTCLQPTPLDDLSSTEREAVSVLAAEGLVLVTRGWAVTLPPRIRHWPVPDTGI
ncbi:DUF5825 family protein [Streptomyces sp. S.PNR 29]|uniref:DUF5825 family protein n=1 Tax=Streptomyces sp. S.PNR 29 TaxID=2973805 RepID=UPI0025B26CF3|nr:DUF5825 family protein [Streptomyces sp. S.PNR 29]MDN0200264.1 DUF5825 family protein [Streptomyces sp. S.PNR 29]